MATVSNKAGDLKKSGPWNSAQLSDEKMQRLDRLANLGLLSAGMAHEIKNGMVAIKTFVDLLAQKNPDAELTEVVGRELQRINTIVTQMMRLAAPRSAPFTKVKIHEVMDHSLRLLQHSISGKLISLKRDYRAEPDTISGDDAQLQQVFMNLLLNAMEAMGTNGALTVSTEIVNGENGQRVLRIQIQDTGTGVKPENLARVFEPFFTTKKNGTGLGLAISHRIVLEHHGTIEVQSETNKGSTFGISLPVSAP
jgi:two-component system, NtrC family, nitrogen regulation sensor histidine kinase GlnL